MAESYDSCQTAFRYRKERDLSEERNLLNCNIQLPGLNLLTEGSSGKALLQEAQLELLKGYHYGLIGRNGVGKTTLLKMIASHRIHGMWKHLRCVYVDDTAAVSASEAPKSTALEYLMNSHEARRKLTEQLAKVLEAGEEDGGEVDVDRLEKVHQQLALLGADAAEARARRILDGLLMDSNACIGQLSGGWLHRLALATALFVEADILLLDEPTNHLDLKATQWLNEFLQGSSSTIVVVSHDTLFLDAVADHIIHFEGKKLTNYTGNFSRFLETRAAKLQKHKRMFVAQENRRRSMERTIENITKRAEKGDASCARQIHSRKRALTQRLGASLDGVYWKYGHMGPRPEILAPEEEEPFVFDCPTDLSDLPDGSEDGALLIASDLGFSWTPDGPALFDHIHLKLGVGTRLAIVGVNGAGKTTFLRVLLEELKYSRGTIMRWEGLRLGYLAQGAITLVASDPNYASLAPIQYIVDKMGWSGDKGLKKARNVLGGFGLIGTIAEEQAVSTLSSGQRSRLLMAEIIAKKPHILILDEPSSHLDQESTGALIDALQSFDGGIVVATHDQHLAENVASDFMCFVGEGSVDRTVHVLESFEDCLKMLAPQLRGVGKLEPGATAGTRKASKAKAAKAEEVSSKATANTSQREAKQAEIAMVSETQVPVKAVVCRHCRGNHFTWACTEQETAPIPPGQPAPVKPKPQKEVVVPPTLKEKAKDGQGDWKVAVSKNTMKRIKRGK